MLNKRKKMIKDIIKNGKTKTWLEYSIKYNFKDAKQANDAYRYYIRTGNIVPVENESDSLEDVKNTVNVGIELPEGAVLEGGWLKSNKGSFRYSVPKSNTVELKESIKEAMKNFSPKIEKIETKKESNKAIMLSIPDLHYGKGSLDITSQIFKTAVVDLVSRYDLNTIEKFIVPLGNDILNSDGASKATTKGTPQFDSADPYECFNRALQDCIDVVSSLATVAPVEVICVHGNHDKYESWTLFKALEGYMINNKNVTINNDPEARTYIQYGNTGFMIDHGELKPEQYPNVFAAEQPKLWGDTIYREAILGHRHHQDTKEYRGFIVRYLPALCMSDRWHRDNAYTAMRAAQSYSYDKVKGFTGMEEFRLV